MNNSDELFQDAVKGLLAGDFSRLEPLFKTESNKDAYQCKIIEWYEQELFLNEPKALAEALTCACFLGRVEVAGYLLNQGIEITAGDGTGMNAFHWAANRGHLNVVKFLIKQNAPLEIKNMYGGTVLGSALHAVLFETKPTHLEIIEELIKAGAKIEETYYPTGDNQVDEILQRYLVA